MKNQKKSSVIHNSLSESQFSDRRLKKSFRLLLTKKSAIASVIQVTGSGEQSDVRLKKSIKSL